MKGWRKSRSRVKDLEAPLIQLHETHVSLSHTVDSKDATQPSHPPHRGSFSDVEYTHVTDTTPSAFLPLRSASLEQRFDQWCKRVDRIYDALLKNRWIARQMLLAKSER